MVLLSSDDLVRNLINLDLIVEILTKANEKNIWFESNLNLSFINIDFSIMNEREYLRKTISPISQLPLSSPEDGL